MGEIWDFQKNMKRRRAGWAAPLFWIGVRKRRDGGKDKDREGLRRGQIQSVPKAGRTSSSSDKGLMVADRHGLWSPSLPQRGLLVVQGLQQPESLAGTQRPVLGGRGAAPG